MGPASRSPGLLSHVNSGQLVSWAHGLPWYVLLPGPPTGIVPGDCLVMAVGWRVEDALNCWPRLFRDLNRNRIRLIEGLTLQGLDSLSVLGGSSQNNISKLTDGAFWGLARMHAL